MSDRFEREPGRDDGGSYSTSMMRLLGQMLMLPFSVFVYGMDVFVRTIQGVQRTAGEGMDVVAGRAATPPADSAGARSEPAASAASSPTGDVINDAAGTNTKEAIDMTDRDLSDDKQLKLVRYKILFIKRDYEVAFPEKEELVSDSMDESAYTAWKVAEFIQRLDETPVPHKWGGSKIEKERPKYPKDSHGVLLARYREGEWIIHKLPEDDKKYLRVYFQVLDRYDREEFKYHERQIEVLEEIRDRIKV
jgi:hypothetical protein